MQTPKTRSASSEINRKASPSTPKSNRSIKLAGSVSDSAIAANILSKTPSNGSPRVINSHSPRSSVQEKKRPSKVVELECQLSQLREDLRKTKDQLNTSESSMKQAQEEAEEAKQQAALMTAKAKEFQTHLLELSAAEEVRLEEFNMISQEWDKAWQLELEAVQDQHSADSGSLEAAMAEIQRLKVQLNTSVKSEAALTEQSQQAQLKLQKFRAELAEKNSVIENLEFQLRDHKKAQSETQDKLNEALKELESSNASMGTLHTDDLKLRESLSTKVFKLEESEARIRSLEENYLQNDCLNGTNLKVHCSKFPQCCSIETDIEFLEASKCRHWEEEIASLLKLHSALESAEHLRSSSEVTQIELDSKLKDARLEIDVLKENLTDKEAQVENLKGKIRDLRSKLDRIHISQTESELSLTELKLEVITKETALQGIMDGNELLKSEMTKREVESHEAQEMLLTELELARSREQEAIIRLKYSTDEADKSSRRAARAAEQLHALQTTQSEMEAELRRLRVQSEQWRKAAEAAATILTSTHNGRIVERTGSLDSEYYSVKKLMSSPYSDDFDDDGDSPRRKSSSMLRKIGGLWKKNQKRKLI